MRVGIFSYDFTPPIGGLGVSLRLLHETMRKMFKDDELLIFSPSPGADGTDVSLFARHAWKRPGGCPAFSLSLLWTLKSLIRKHQLDLVHVHAGSGGVWLLTKPQCPLVVTAHHTYMQEAQLVYRRRPFTAFRKRLIGMLERRTYQLADTVICVSVDTRQAIIDDYKIDPAKLVVVENAVRPAHGPRAHLRSKAIVYVGRIEPRKGVWTLLEAFSKVHASFPDLTLRLVGENSLGSKLWNFLRERKLLSRVTTLGYVFEPYRQREVTHSLAVVIPSLLEGFGLTAAEAMASGACVLASDCPGLRSIVTNGKTGMLFTAGSVDSCVATLQKVLHDDALRERLGEAARKEANERFAPERQSREIHQIYTQLTRRAR